MRKKGNTVLAGLIICLLLVFLAAAGKLFGAYLKYQKGDVSYKDKNLQIDIRCHTVFMNDQKIELSLKEFTVLKYLTEHPGWVFSHEEIYRNVWKEEPIDCANAVMCCISQLRKKLKVDSRNWNYIRTVRGVGYKFQPLSGE